MFQGKSLLVSISSRNNSECLLPGLQLMIQLRTAAGKPLCDQNGVQGFPTLKWGEPSALEDYQGGRDYAALLKFAEDNLKPMCSPKNIGLCSADQKEKIETVQAMSQDELKEAIKKSEDEIATIESDFKTMVEGLQKSYEEG